MLASWRTEGAEAGCRQDAKMKWQPPSTSQHLTPVFLSDQSFIPGGCAAPQPSALLNREGMWADDEALRHSSFQKSQITWRDRCRLKPPLILKYQLRFQVAGRKCCCRIKPRWMLFITLTERSKQERFSSARWIRLFRFVIQKPTYISNFLSTCFSVLGGEAAHTSR